MKTKEIILNSKKVEKTCPKITDKPNPERTIVPEKPKASEREKNFEKTGEQSQSKSLVTCS